MSGLLDRIYQIKNPGVPRYANTDLYRANNNLPLDGESHERYIATKAPIRKNKEYRGRFRSYSFGYPTYKKDAYMRHWYNFVDVMLNKEAPLLRYTKLYFTGFLFGTLVGGMGGFNQLYAKQANTTAITQHKMSTTRDYTKFNFLSELKAFYKNGKPSGVRYGLLTSVFFMLHDKFRQFEYSKAQSILRAVCILSPAIAFIQMDRPFTNFFYRSAIYAFLSFFALHFLLVDKNSTMQGSARNHHTSEKFYLKSVSPAEKEKIEYEDMIQLFALRFNINAANNIENHLENNRSFI